MRKIIGILIGVALLMSIPTMVLALSTADITVTATPQSLAITVDPTTQDFADVAVSETPVTGINYFTIDNTSNVVTDHTIGVQSNNWSGGVTWTHSDTCTPGADTAGLRAGLDDADDLYDVIVKYTDPVLIADDQAIATDYDFGLKLYVPTSFGDAVEKEITVRVTVAASS